MNKKVLVSIFIVFVLLLVGRFYFNSHMMKMRMMRMAGMKMSVEVKNPIEIDYLEKKEYAARTEAKHTVNLIARVSGYLGERCFKEGDFVTKGQLLFKIKPQDFVVAVNQAKANMNRTQASLVASEKNLKRVSELVEKDFISKSQFDDALAQRDSLKASLEGDKALLQQAKLNLGYTNIYAPVSGKIGKIFITEGNFIDRASGSLATIVSLDPIYVSFNIDSQEYLSSKFNKNMLVELILPDGSIYPTKGKIDFLNNQIDQTTGTVTLRATFKNNDKLLLPGQFLNVNVYSKKTIKKLAIPQEAVMENPAGKFVMVVNKESKVKVKPIITGKQQNGLLIVNEGLTKDDKVIIKGLQKIMPEMPVDIAKPKTQAESQNNKQEGDSSDK